jgi:hypothetical protein
VAKKPKKAVRNTALDRLAARLRTALRRESESAVKIGNLLIECRKHVPPGKWQAWLAENFALSYRTAHRYEGAAKYVAGKRKSDTVADFANLSPSVLYDLAEGHFDEAEEAVILAASRERRVGEDAALTICRNLAPADAGDDDDDDQGDDAGDDDTGDDDAEQAAAEAAATIDGPPPAVPPPPPNLAPTDFALRDFDQAIGTLNRLRTKLLAQFARTSHGADVLKNVEDFIHAVIESR